MQLISSDPSDENYLSTADSKMDTSECFVIGKESLESFKDNLSKDGPNGDDSMSNGKSNFDEEPMSLELSADSPTNDHTCNSDTEATPIISESNDPQIESSVNVSSETSEKDNNEKPIDHTEEQPREIEQVSECKEIVIDQDICNISLENSDQSALPDSSNVEGNKILTDNFLTINDDELLSDTDRIIPEIAEKETNEVDSTESPAELDKTLEDDSKTVPSMKELDESEFLSLNLSPDEEAALLKDNSTEDINIETSNCGEITVDSIHDTESFQKCDNGVSATDHCESVKNKDITSDQLRNNEKLTLENNDDQSNTSNSTEIPVEKTISDGLELKDCGNNSDADKETNVTDSVVENLQEINTLNHVKIEPTTLNGIESMIDDISCENDSQQDLSQINLVPPKSEKIDDSNGDTEQIVKTEEIHMEMQVDEEAIVSKDSDRIVSSPDVNNVVDSLNKMVEIKAESMLLSDDEESENPQMICDTSSKKNYECKDSKETDSGTANSSPLTLTENEKNKKPDIKDESMVVSDDDDSNSPQIISDSTNEVQTADSDPIETNKSDNVTNSGKSTSDDTQKKQEICVTLDDDDDDIVLIDDNSSKTVNKALENSKDTANATANSEKTSQIPTVENSGSTTNNEPEKPSQKEEPISPLTIMKKVKPLLDSMSREDLEEFIVVKLAESIAGRSPISDMELRLKSQEKSMEEWRKKVMSLTKQNKDLTIVLRNLNDEHQKRIKENPLPIKITRSVGLQVGYPTVNKTDKNVASAIAQSASAVAQSASAETNTNVNNIPKQPAKPIVSKNLSTPPTSTYLTRRGKEKVTTTQVSNMNVPQSTPSPSVPQITSQTQTAPTPTPPVPQIVLKPKKPSVAVLPKLVPVTQNSAPNKSAPRQVPRNVPTIMRKVAEKRPSLPSIDLTDDEPPAKIPATRTPPRPVPTIRPVNTKQLTNPTRMTYVVNNSASPNARPVYIPIGSGQNVSPNSLMVRGKLLNKVPVTNIRQITTPGRMSQPIPIRPGVPQHPAPLPQSFNSKALLNSTWKWIPPRPTLKIARVENGIVISWEMEDFSDVQHEPVASYQIFAYQEASSLPTTDLWKKIGDVKALPLPMACTLTHFMAGFKYHFAVRAIDIRTRVGPFSAPAQITLVNNK